VEEQVNATFTRTQSQASGITAAVATLGVAAACWIPAVHQMNEMVSVNRLGSVAFFGGMWLSMMAAMMLPGAVPAVAGRARLSGRLRATPIFVLSYLAVWTLVGAAIYALYRPPSSFAVGVVTIAAGVYELTPVKQHFRLRCFERGRSGLEFGMCCVGSSIGLMAVLVVLGLMSVGWTIVITAVVVAQKLVSPKIAIDVPVALAIVALGILILLDPSSVPGLMTMTPM
jgi:predicted metal-binding membrane protein